LIWPVKNSTTRLAALGVGVNSAIGVSAGFPAMTSSFAMVALLCVITSFITRYKTKAEMSMTSAIPFIFLVG
jgi:hypothetical protein